MAVIPSVDVDRTRLHGRGCLHPTLRLQGQAAPRFTELLRQLGGGAYAPHGSIALMEHHHVLEVGVCCALARAHATASRCTPQSGQRRRRSEHSITHRLPPRSRWRQRLIRWSWISELPAGLPADRAHPPAATQAHGHDHSLAAEADVDDRRTGQAQQANELPGDAHVDLLREPLILRTPSSLQRGRRRVARPLRNLQQNLNRESPAHAAPTTRPSPPKRGETRLGRRP